MVICDDILFFCLTFEGFIGTFVEIWFGLEFFEDAFNLGIITYVST